MLRWTGIFAVALLLLAGCSQPHGADARHCAPNMTQTQCQAIDHYIAQVNAVVMRNFHHAQRYAGQRCLVTAQRRADGRYSVMRTEGNESLCLSAWQSVSSARDMPLPPQGAPRQWVFAFAP
ncbi:TolA-like protein [Pantoea sp. PNA 14-12]|uniref:cell envelope integrity protein TolA n=1 Tax=Pantoea TaxID=53335 RepID=UPI001061FF7B|nr:MULTISPECIES: cell envelope integrity protein TolA [Pantoea]TDS71358.1 TolA-like protein [Pantoea sp. PNA 14-12]